MKKLIRFALAVVLCFSMSTTVFAAPSPEINSPVVDNSGSIGSVASPVKPVVQAGHSLNMAQQATVASYGTVEKMFESVSNVQIKNFDEKKVVTIDLEAEIPAGGAWVEIMKWSDIHFGENDNSVMVLHMNEAGQLESIMWNVIYTNGEPVLVGFFTSLSPVWVAPLEVEVPDSSVDGGNGGDNGDNGGDNGNGDSVVPGLSSTVTEQVLNEKQKATLASYGSLEKMFEGVSGILLKNFDENRVIEIDVEAKDIPAGGAWVQIMELAKVGRTVADDGILIVHMDDNGNPEIVSWRVVDGIIEGYFTSLSPVWIAPVEVETTISSWYYDPAIDGPIDPSLPASSGISPKTADNSMSLYVVMLAVAACGVMVCKTRKVK